MKKKLFAGAILSVLSFGALADTPSFNNIEIGYSNIDFDGLPDFSGFEIKGSKELSENWYLAGDYTDVSEGGFSLSLTTFGFGYKNDFSDSSSYFAEIDYARLDADGGVDESGYEISFGVRSMLSNELELKAAIEYLDIDNEDTTYLVLGSAYNFTDNMALYADYKYESDVSEYGVGVRFSF